MEMVSWSLTGLRGFPLMTPDYCMSVVAVGGVYRIRASLEIGIAVGMVVALVRVAG